MFKKIIFTSAMLVSALSAHATGSAAIGVTGTITPAACDITVTGGTISMGTLTSAAVKAYTLLSTSYTFPTVNVPFKVVCTAATRVGMSFVDNNAGKVFSLNSTSELVNFGIVDGTGTKAIGAYRMGFGSVTIDGTAIATNAGYLETVNGGTAWATTAAGGVLPSWYAAPGYTNGFTKTGTTPDAVTTLAGSLYFYPYVSSDYVLNATSAITPTGSGTISLVYL